MFAPKRQLPLGKNPFYPPSPGVKQGFTLIELIVGIVVFSVALTLFSSALVPHAVRSVDPIFQVRAIELARSLINEIAGKSFDENSSRSGGLSRCNEAGASPCTASSDLGPDGAETRAEFNDMDDYHNLLEADGGIRNFSGEGIAIGSLNVYQGFQARVSVFYDDDMNGIDDGNIGNRKLITVSIVTPNGEVIVFSTYRVNY